ncbi:ATP-binding protein [Streptomyces herbicida]|uniref:ATP-binding protein n=1 Tax=Streptomyces herbicida TaxID=3065675 RepID=UPI002930D4CD|nr:ATP-binding protein [Streptomyces sp. NEAU-HV9]
MAVSALRRRARTLLAQWRVPATTVDDALLVISELTTNAIAHALPPAVLRLSVPEAAGSRALRIEVTNAGPAAQRHPHDSPHPCEHRENGRGTDIVAALCPQHGISRPPRGPPDGRISTCELDHPWRGSHTSTGTSRKVREATEPARCRMVPRHHAPDTGTRRAGSGPATCAAAWSAQPTVARLTAGDSQRTQTAGLSGGRVRNPPTGEANRHERSGFAGDQPDGRS